MVKSKENLKLLLVFLVIIAISLGSGKIIRQIIFTFGDLSEVQISGYSICNSYYRPYYDEYRVDIHPTGLYPFTDKYLYGIKINNPNEGGFGKELVINAELYQLGNKGAIKIIDSFYK